MKKSNSKKIYRFVGFFIEKKRRKKRHIKATQSKTKAEAKKLSEKKRTLIFVIK